MGKKQSKQRKLDMAVALIHRRFGSRSLVKGRKPTVTGASSGVPHIPTSFPALDQALGIGGLPKGRVSELLGPATSGKTTVALKLLTQAQAAGNQVGYIDQGRYLNIDYAHRCGVDLSRLWVGKPYDAGEAMAMIEALARSGGFPALVVDTLDIFWTDPGHASHLIALLDRLAPLLDSSSTTLLFLHDAAANHSQALSAVAHYASVRIALTRERWLRQHGDIRGYEARVEVLKNRFAPLGRAVKLAIEFNGTVRGNGL